MVRTVTGEWALVCSFRLLRGPTVLMAVSDFE